MITLNSGDTIELQVDDNSLYLSTIDSTLMPLESTVIRLETSEVENLINKLIEALSDIKAISIQH